MRRASNPMRRSWLDDSEGGWIAHRLRLVMSPAWRFRPRPLCRILERIEIEHMRHGGQENGHLCVSFDQFVAEGVSRRVVAPALDAGVALGLVEVIQSGELLRNIRMPNEYRLTYVPAKDRRAPTDEWASVTEAEAQAAVVAFQRATATGHQKQSASSLSCSAPVPFPASKTPSSSSLSCNPPVPERELPLISGRMAADG